MKYRNDFVTNSSSSSFIVARKPEFTKEQEKVILDFVKEKMLGKIVATTKEELDKYYLEEFDEDVNDEYFINSYKYRYYKNCLDALEKGLSIYSGWVNFECEDNGVDMLTTLWEDLENANNNDFVGIDTSLDY